MHEELIYDMKYVYKPHSLNLFKQKAGEKVLKCSREEKIDITAKCCY